MTRENGPRQPGGGRQMAGPRAWRRGQKERIRSPSPLAGEGGERRRREPGEGFFSKPTPHPVAGGGGRAAPPPPPRGRGGGGGGGDLGGGQYKDYTFSINANP